MPSVTVNGGSGNFVVVNYANVDYYNLATSLLGGVDTATGQIITGDSQVIAGDTVVTGVGTLNDPSGTGISVTVADGSVNPNQEVLIGDGSNVNFYTTIGGGTIIAGTGADTFSVGGNGNWDINTGSSGSQIFLNGGSDTVSSGGADTVVAGSGANTVFGSAGDKVFGGSGSLTYVASTGDTVVAGSGVTFGYGADGGSTSFFLGSGESILVAGTDGSLTVAGGSGTTQSFGNDGSSISFSGSSDNNMFVAGTGNETLNAAGSSGANVFYAGSGNDSVTAGSGDDILFGGMGDSTLTGGAGTNVFAFVDQTGGSTAADTVTDFNSTSIVELINGVTITNEDLTSTPGSDVVSLSDGTVVTFTGVSTDLNSSGQVFHF